jgi:hypothetical protein
MAHILFVVQDGIFRVAQECGRLSKEEVLSFLERAEPEFFEHLYQIKPLVKWPMPQWEVRDGKVVMNDPSAVEAATRHLGYEIGAGILDYIQETEYPELIHEIALAGNSLECEGAILLDVDNSCLEIYEGDNLDPLEEGDRFYFLDYPEAVFHPIKLAERVPLVNAVAKYMKEMRDVET